MNKKVPWGEMAALAKTVRARAHAPYSKFPVGAVIWADGRLFAGCNVENVSYPVGSCAERGALSAMVAAGITRIHALLLCADQSITPCGMCRQALSEFGRDFPVRSVVVGRERVLETDMGALLPDGFTFVPGGERLD